MLPSPHAHHWDIERKEANASHAISTKAAHEPRHCLTFASHGASPATASLKPPTSRMVTGGLQESPPPPPSSGTLAVTPHATPPGHTHATNLDSFGEAHLLVPNVQLTHTILTPITLTSRMVGCRSSIASVDKSVFACPFASSADCKYLGTGSVLLQWPVTIAST